MPTLQERLAEVFPPPQQRGLQAEIVALCGVSRPTVSNWFNNPEKVAAISRRHAELICERFGLPVEPAWLGEGKLPKRATHEDSAAAAVRTIDEWSVHASPRSREVIDQLRLMAQKNVLGDEDWEMIRQLAQRFQKSKK